MFVSIQNGLALNSVKWYFVSRFEIKLILSKLFFLYVNQDKMATNVEDVQALLLRDYREMKPVPSIVQAYTNKAIRFPEDNGNKLMATSSSCKENPTTGDWLDFRFQTILVTKVQCFEKTSYISDLAR